MGCCGGGHCDFQFPPGPPLVEEPVAHLNARWLFMPRGTRFQTGDMVRLWMQNGKTRTVFVAEVMPVDYNRYPPRIIGAQSPTWAQVALDSDQDEQSLIQWRDHPLFDPGYPPCVLGFDHFVAEEPTLWTRWKRLLYTLRNL